MTEQYKGNLDFIYDSDGKSYSLTDCCDLLNELSEENEQLKKQVNPANRFHSLDNSKYKKVIEENKHLKQSNELLGDMADKYQKLYYESDEENTIIQKNFKGLSHNYGLLYDEYTQKIESLKQENGQLKQSIQEYKAILQDMGILMSDEDVVNIRNDIADKLLKPLFKSNGFDVDIDTTDGFTIIPKGDME